MRDCHSSSISVKFRNRTATVAKSADGFFHCLGCDKQFASPSSLRTHASKCSVSHYGLAHSFAGGDDAAFGSTGDDKFMNDDDLPIYEQHLNYRSIIHQIMPAYQSLSEPDRLNIKKAVTKFLESALKEDFSDCIVYANQEGKRSTLSIPDHLVEDFKKWSYDELLRMFPSAKLRMP
ncbi:hypothetical protein BDR26DRAFT_866979 [Obelidium mucronatum]|nr:hypothetical protein BDR26DRAFT_866979 [Obelidium mucronatum]